MLSKRSLTPRALLQSTTVTRMAGPPGADSKPAKGPKKGKEGAIEMDGVVLESLPNAMFRVELDANQAVSPIHDPQSFVNVSTQAENVLGGGKWRIWAIYGGASI